MSGDRERARPRVDEAQGGDARRPGSWRLLAGSVVVLIAVGAVAAVRHDGAGAGSAGTKATGSAALETVRRTTLREQERVDGSLGYGKARPVTNDLPGKITSIAPEGSTVQRGEALYRVNDVPVLLLYGEVPAYRRMARGMEDGPDVRQLEANLEELGVAAGLISKPDDHFDAGTEAAVKRWQKRLGLDQDGVLEVGEVVFLPGARRIGAHKAAVGAESRPGQEVLETTGTSRVVTVELDARKQSLVKAGDKVDVELPGGGGGGGKVVGGTVTEVGKVAKTSSGSGSGSSGSGSGGSSGSSGAGSGSSAKPTVTVTVALDEQRDAGDLDGAPVKVRITRASKQGVLAVPVNALLALPEGGYGVEVDHNGARRVVKVETGLFSGGLVEVSGEGISEGTKVVVPT